MAETIEIEVDDIHTLMFKEIMSSQEDAPELEDWAEDTLQAILYQTYQNKDNLSPAGE